jgi:hypothetical protein
MMIRRYRCFELGYLYFEFVRIDICGVAIIIPQHRTYFEPILYFFGGL